MSNLIFLIFTQIIAIINSIPTCFENSNFCIHCNNLTNLCVKCDKSDILIPDENGGCKGAKRCVNGKNFCLECDSEQKLCKNCEQNFYPDDNGGCTYSGGCEISYMGECLKCKDDYILIGIGTSIKICKSLSLEIYKNCQEINNITGLCKTCEEGYYLTSVDHKCVKTNYCKESIFGTCISCDPCYNYDKKLDKCVLKELNLTYCKQSIDGINCDVCDEGYYHDETGICMESPFCSESFYFKCTKCIPGYYLSTFKMCTNTDNCYEVDKESSICTYCQKQYYLDKKDYTCKSNLEDGPYKYCTVVENDGCYLCEHGYYLGEDLKCSNSRHCAESENGVCNSCSENFYLGLDHICTDAERCIYSKDGICIECEQGYYYNEFNNTCEEMENQFLGCKFTCALGDKCCECKDDYYLFLNDSLCYDNTEGPFTKCAYVFEDGSRCKICIDGYYLGMDDDKCCKVQNCKIVENENKCLECVDFYCLDTKKQKCVDNDFLEDINDKIYISCKRTNTEGTACEECLDGYEVNEEGFCVDSDLCEEKKDGKCNKCKDIVINDYSLCANELFGCIRSSQDNCLRCDNLDDLYECTECKEGYVKNGYFCEKQE